MYADFVVVFRIFLNYLKMKNEEKSEKNEEKMKICK